MFSFFVEYDGVLVVAARENLVRVEGLDVHAKDSRDAGAVKTHVRRLSAVIADQVRTNELVGNLVEINCFLINNERILSHKVLSYLAQ